MATNLPRHLPALDGLRGVAILMVVLTHVNFGWQAARAGLLENVSGLPRTFDLPDFLFTIGAQGQNGVSLFFVVSAFTLTLRAQGDRGGLAAYALRRIARIGPGFWLALLAYTTLAALTSDYLAHVSGTDLAIGALFMGEWWGGTALGVVPGGWSVSCEATFYIALPVLLWIIRGHVLRAAVLTVLAAFVAQQRATAMASAGDWSFVAYVHPVQQAPLFLAGITAALVTMQTTLPRMRALAVVVLLFEIVVLPSAPYVVSEWVIQRYLMFGACTAVVVALAAVDPPWLLANRVMRRIGEVSYSMYLVHFALLGTSLRFAEWLLPASNGWTMLLHLAMTGCATFAIACVTYRWVEQPAIRWAARRLQPATPALAT